MGLDPPVTALRAGKVTVLMRRPVGVLESQAINLRKESAVVDFLDCL
jgi:hypothetical protein